MYLILHTLNDIDEFSETLCWVISTIVVCLKMTNIILRRNDIIDLLEILNKNSFQPRNIDEKNRQEKFDFTSRKYTKFFFIIIFSTTVALTIGGVMKGNNANLPFKASYPFDEKRVETFWTLYIIQCLNIYSSGCVTVGFETLIMVLIIQICSQLDIIYHRLQTLPDLHNKFSSAIS
ncbi:odorant receptor 46a-like [Leptopilina heterotoma]|uniref:odorant receptor 46a-like n=1 Tax=Leptopilina heterotoma TaxID=63436 RepID=UPI001CA93791|nr:odorant receptor 46a-like [Leptopilina heterotoma]